MAFTTETGKKAGEKSKRGEALITKSLRELITDEDAEIAFEKLKEIALSGQNFKALELYIAYAFGKPKQQDEQQGQKHLIVKVVEDKEEEEQQVFKIGNQIIRF